MWGLFQLLWVSYFAQWVGIVVVVCGVFYMLSKWHNQLPFHLKTAFLVGTAVWLCFFIASFTNYYQSGVINNAVANVRQQEAANGETPLQMKAKFLNDVDALAQNPDKITPEMKQKFFNVYAPLFPKGRDEWVTAYQSLDAAYQCQKIFWEDALASYKAKKEMKSENRKKCETLSGVFFNREKLLGPDLVKRNDELIKTFSAHKRVPASENGGKEVEINEKTISQSLDAQSKAVDGLHKLFQ